MRAATSWATCLIGATGRSISISFCGWTSWGGLRQTAWLSIAWPAATSSISTGSGLEGKDASGSCRTEYPGPLQDEQQDRDQDDRGSLDIAVIPMQVIDQEQENA